MVTDVSSVGLDWLYLRTDRPLFLTDRHDDPERLRAGGAGESVRRRRRLDNVHGLSALVGDRLQHDELHPARVSMRHHYFDDVAVGESTARFIDAVNDLVALPRSPF